MKKKFNKIDESKVVGTGLVLHGINQVKRSLKNIPQMGSGKQDFADDW